MASRQTLILLAAACGGGVAHAAVEHVVVAMLENRAFDHLLGFMKRGGPYGDTRVDGLTGAECNANNLTNASEGITCVDDQAFDRCEYDPDHSFARTTERIFGCRWQVTPGTPCVDMKSTSGNNDMSGFVDSARHKGQSGKNEMSMWPPERVPVLTTLAKEYALFDRFFASHPGSTYPNRQFVLSATAHGMTDTGGAVPKGGFPQRTVLRSFEEAGLSWRMYYEDSLAWAIFLADVQRNSSKPNIKEMGEFYEDAARGRLANFTFIEPRISANPNASQSPSYGLPNHQHPRESVREGERWMKNVYEAVRNGPRWNSTLLIFTYDEHGGFFDHVPPPQTGVPSPDGICTSEGFEYTRLGVRIPTVVISPWIAKGTLVHDPPAAQRPTDTSEYELSSIPATLRKLFPQIGGPLTRRDQWAASFEHLLTKTYRADAPTKMPDVPPPHADAMERSLSAPLDEHAQGLIKTLCSLNGVGDGEKEPCGHGIATYRHFAPWVERMWAAWHRPPRKADAASH
jgi:phospholipase C